MLFVIAVQLIQNASDVHKSVRSWTKAIIYYIAVVKSFVVDDRLQQHNKNMFVNPNKVGFKNRRVHLMGKMR